MALTPISEEEQNFARLCCLLMSSELKFTLSNLLPKPQILKSINHQRYRYNQENIAYLLQEIDSRCEIQGKHTELSIERKSIQRLKSIFKKLITNKSQALSRDEFKCFFDELTECIKEMDECENTTISPNDWGKYEAARITDRKLKNVKDWISLQSKYMMEDQVEKDSWEWIKIEAYKKYFFHSMERSLSGWEMVDIIEPESIRKKEEEYYCHIEELCKRKYKQSIVPLEEIDIHVNMKSHRSESLKHIAEVLKHPVHVIVVTTKGGVGKNVMSNRLTHEWINEFENPMKSFDCVFKLDTRGWDTRHTFLEGVVHQLVGRIDSRSIEAINALLKNKKRCLFCIKMDEIQDNKWAEVLGFIQDNAKHGVFFILETGLFNMVATKVQHLLPLFFTVKHFTGETLHFRALNYFSKLEDFDTSSHLSSALETILNEYDLTDFLDQTFLQYMCKTVMRFGLPESLSRFYQCICTLLLQDKNTYNFSNLQVLLLHLGELCFESLHRAESMIISLTDKISEFSIESIVEKGLLVPYNGTASAQQYSEYVCANDSLGLYLAALYIGKEFEKGNHVPWEKLKSKVSSVESLRNYGLLLTFCSGTSVNLCKEILELSDMVAFDIDPCAKRLQGILKKVSVDEVLEAEDVFFGNSFKISDSIESILNFQRQCLQNSEHIPGISVLMNSILDFSFKPELLRKLLQSGKLKPTNSYIIFAATHEFETVAEHCKSAVWFVIKAHGAQENWELPLEELFDHPFCCQFKCAEMHSISSLILFLNAIAQNENLKHFDLDLHESRLEGSQWESIFNALQQMKVVSGLDLSYCNIPHRLLGRLGQILSSNTKLLSLQLSGKFGGYFNCLTNQITPEDKTLELIALKLAGSHLRQSDKESLKSLITKCPNLKHLSLDDCKCEVSEAVIKLKHLKKLSVCDTVDCTPEKGLNVGKLLSNLHLLGYLEILRAEWCNMSYIQIKQMQPLMLSKIVILSLRRNHLRDEGLKHISGLSPYLPSLQELDIRSNWIQDEGIKFFFERVEKFPNLKQVYAINNQITKDVYDELKREFLSKGIDFN